MGFERFERKTGKTMSPVISLWKCGQIGFNKAAVQKFRIDEYPYAVLYYDRGGDRIGIELTKDIREGAIRILGKGQTGIRVSAKSFLSYCNWGVKRQRFKIRKEGILLVINKEG